MHRGLIHVGAWMLATAAAVTLSWFGVHSVLRVAYDPPRALPVSDLGDAAPSPAGSTRPPVASSTHRPKPTPTATPTTTHKASEAQVPPKRPPGTPRSTASASGDTGNVHSYTVAGGRVALDLGPTSASLVSATPNPGWQMQVWTLDGWLRVTFTQTSGGGSSSVFCTWNGHPPTVEAFED